METKCDGKVREWDDAGSVLAAIQEPAAYGGNPPFWQEAIAAMPVAGLPFLEPAGIPVRRAAAGLLPERDSHLVEIAAIVAADPALTRFLWYLHWRMFIANEHGVPWGAPTLINRLGERAGAFYLLLALEFAPCLAARHRQQGYPASVTEETLQQIRSFEMNHLRGRGVPGIYERQVAWLVTYLTQPYVRLGRFEYQLHAYDGGVSVWRRPGDGQVVALAEEGTRVGEAGLRLSDDAPAGSFWVAHLEETPESVRGWPVDPVGRVLQSPVRLDRAVWVPCFSKGSTVLDLHIPAGGGMEWDAMVDSFRQAVNFFKCHHADRPFAALVVTTWFMDPQLEPLLPAEANPLRLQRAVYCYPVRPWPDGLWFVFLRETGTPANLPRDTSLRRQLAQFLERGGVWHGGGMFILPDDMCDLREGCYRTRFKALRAELDPG